jgi:hypothetical protein
MDGALDTAYAHELRGEQAERDAEAAAEEELIQRWTLNGAGHLLEGQRVINDQADVVAEMKRADRYRETLASIYRFVDELDMKLLEGELVEPEDKLRRSSELLYANEVIDGVKSRIQRMYVGKAGGR